MPAPSKVQRLLRRVADFPSSLIWTTDTDGKCTFMSAAIRALFSESDAVYLPDLLELVHPDDVDTVRTARAEARKACEEYQCEYRVVKSDGTVRLILGFAAPRFTQDGLFDGYTGAWIDVTAQHQAVTKLADSEANLREIIAITPAGYIEIDGNGIVLEVNPALCAMSGYNCDELVGQHISAFVKDCPIVEMLTVRGGASSVRGKEIVMTRKSGDVVCLLVNLTIKRDTDGKAISLAAFVNDITERKRDADRIEHLATHDLLTGLPNRLSMRKHLQQTLEAKPAYDTIAVMFIDLDRFKQVNDSLGHLAGDSVLQQAACRLQQTLRSGDRIARFGGDEFIVVSHCPRGRADAAALAEALLATLGRAFQIEGHEVFLGASIGISMLAENACSKPVLYQNADVAMYQAKASGRNKYRFFEEDMATQAKGRLALESALRHALERQELHVHYQPQVDLCTGKVVGMEALLRWQHPEWGSVPPARFIPVAEETGLIIPIGAWVLRTACLQAVAWRAAGLGELRIGVNLSARQFEQADLIPVVTAVLEESGLPAHQLDLELTEAMVMTDIDHAVSVLNQLKTLGVKLSVDDFGTGYSSLSYLKRFPIDMLKIDRSFVQEILQHSSGAAIPDAIIAMAHSLGIRVIAEGVETDAQCEVLSHKMCDEIQGFLFSDVLPPERAEQLILGGQVLPAHLLRSHSPVRMLLLVDDEPNILSALRRQLRGAGYQILTASSGHEGLDLLLRNKVDVIVSDQRMPGMTGVEFLRTVKQMYPETVRIVLSGFTELQAVTDAVNEGAIYKFLTKPWDDMQLREHIAQAFKHKEMADENRRLSLEVRAANQGLAAANRQLEEVLRRQRQQIKHDEITLDIVREVLQHVPVPVIGLDDDQVIVFANTAAHCLFPEAGLPLGSDVQEIMPEVLQAIRDLEEGKSACAEIVGRRFDVAYRRMGNGTHSSGILVTLTPPAFAYQPVAAACGALLN